MPAVERDFLLAFACGDTLFDQVFNITAFVWYAFELFYYFGLCIDHDRKTVSLDVLRLPFFYRFRARLRFPFCFFLYFY